MSERSFPQTPPVVHPIHHHTAGFWALMSVCAFPLILLVLSFWHVSVLASFALAIMGTCLILCLNVLLEHGLWMFHPRWRVHFEKPDASFRLAVASGALLLLIETAMIVYFFVVPGIDATMLGFVKYRLCTNPTDQYQELCQVLDR